MLDFGGDDVTEFMLSMLNDVKFPYPKADMSRLSDLNIMDDLKARMSTLLEASQTEGTSWAMTMIDIV